MRHWATELIGPLTFFTIDEYVPHQQGMDMPAPTRKEQIEEENPGTTVINATELAHRLPELYSWIKEDLFRGSVNEMDEKLLITDKVTDIRSRAVHVELYTEAHCYSISAIEPTDSDHPDGYLGCVASTRKNRAGEDWNRGNDLPDGPYNEETWKGILKGIVAFELVPLEIDE